MAVKYSSTTPARLNSDIGGLVAKTMKDKKLNMSQVARAAGLRPGHVEQIVKGSIQPHRMSLFIADRLALGLGVDLNFFLTKGGAAKKAKKS